MAVSLTLNQVPLPANYGDWFPVGQLIGLKWRSTIPSDYLPIQTIAILESIQNTDLMIPNSFDTKFGGMYTGIVSAMQAIYDAAQGINGNFVTGEVLLNRSQGRGTFPTTQYNYLLAPRFGFQIGNFKQQAYFQIYSFCTGLITLGTVAWLSSDTLAKVEYVTNNIMKRFYLSHGKIQEAVSDVVDGMVVLKLADIAQEQNFNFAPSGNLYIWTGTTDSNGNTTYSKKIFDLSSLVLDKNGRIFINSTTYPDVLLVKTGDFFLVEKPWVLEDYTKLFEYGLNKKSGFYETNEQKIKAFSETGKMTIQGVWFQYANITELQDLAAETEGESSSSSDSSETIVFENNVDINDADLSSESSQSSSSMSTNEEDMLLWHVFTDMKDAQLTLPTNNAEQELLGEAKHVAGTLSEGLGYLNKLIKNKKATTARIIVFGAGTKLQNFYTNSLVGEFIKVSVSGKNSTSDAYFEIVGHPRNDTIEVDVNSCNISIDLSDAVKIDKQDVRYMEVIDVLQQKFWFVNELFFGTPSTTGLWNAAAASVTTHDITQTIKVSGSDTTTITTQNVYTDPLGVSTTEEKTVTLPIKISTETTTDKENIIEYKGKTTNIKLLSQDVFSTYMLDVEEKTKTKCSYLTERFYQSFLLEPKDAKNANLLNESYFKKFSGWYFYNISTMKIHKILDAVFKLVSTGQEFTRETFKNHTTPTATKTGGQGNKIEIYLTLDGDLSSEIFVNDTTKGTSSGYIFLDTPFSTVSGLHGEMSFQLKTEPALGADGKYKLLMYGNYFAGLYVLPEPTSSQLTIASFAYGANFGNISYPDIYMSMSSSGRSIAVVMQKIGKNQRTFAFFTDNQSNTLVYRQGYVNWTSELPQKAVYIGKPTECNTAAEVKTNSAIVGITFNASESGAIYWFSYPNGYSDSSFKSSFGIQYFCHYVSENSTAYSQLIEDFYTQPIDISAKYLPIEFVSYKDPNSDSNIVDIDTYFASSFVGKGESSEKVYDSSGGNKADFESFVNGSKKNLVGTPNTSVKNYKYVPQKRLISSSRFFDSIVDDSGDIFMIYGGESGTFSINKKTNSTTSLISYKMDKNLQYKYLIKDDYFKSNSSVFIIKTNANGKYWFSPHISSENQINDTSNFDPKEFEVPMMILYDFNYMASTMSQFDNLCYVFGKVLLDGYETIAVYRFNIKELQINNNMYVLMNESSEWISMASFQKLQQPYYGYSIGEYGRDLSYLSEVINANIFPSEGDQVFKAIMSSNSQSICVDFERTDLNMFIDVDNFEYDGNSYTGIICLKSTNAGISWKIRENTNGILYGSADDICSCYRHPWLFLMDTSNGEISVQNIEKVTAKEFVTKASSIKSSAIIDEHGVLCLYYYGKDGFPSAVFSSNGGVNWKNLNNW